ncbi:MAG TPA: thioredoxin domain-containing protein [Pyrinomonadaceae bacterium]|jgi:protein-disulfide isomerase|nr:thioredoxin domain-containing protein [Pyrinomonadaceae bacterium]
MQKYRPFVVIGIVLVAAIVSYVFLSRPGQNVATPTAVPVTQSTTEAQRKPPAGVVVTLEEFGDYQCPPCGALHPSLKKLKQEYGPNLNFVFRNLPLTELHKNALIAAQAAEAARMQNHFWEMHDLLYENQDLWKDDINPQSIFWKFAADLGLDTARFSRDMADKQVKLRIEADQAAAAGLSINGTPTILIDGREMRPELTNYEGIRKGIDFIMSRKAPSTP